MHQLAKYRFRTLMILVLFCFGTEGFLLAQDPPAVLQSVKKQELGFKIGKLRLHPGISLQNVFDTNVSNASPRYESSEYITRYGTNLENPKATMDDILHIIGSFKLNYPDEKFALTLDSGIRYSRYFGVEAASTKDLSALTGNARLTMAIFPKAIVSAIISDSFSRAVSPQQSGLHHTTNRWYNKASLKLPIRPGGGQLRFFVGYDFVLEEYDATSQKNLNVYQHNFHLDWELEFLPKTAFFMKNEFSLRDYHEFNPAFDNFYTNSASPNAMPLKTMVGIMGRITSKLSLNVSAGYGNSFSKNFDSFNHLLAKAELTAQFTPRTMLKVGFERDYMVVTTFSYMVDNKPYLEFKQWLFSDAFEIYLYGSYSYYQYGSPDPNIYLNVNALDPTQSNFPIPSRSDSMVTVTPSLKYNFLAWLNMELGYTLTWKFSDYQLERFDTSLAAADRYLGVTFYDYLKHEIFLKLSLAY